MPFTKLNFEGSQYRRLERKEIEKGKEKETEKLSTFIKELSEKLKKEGVPVDEDCRIEMTAFGNIYSPEVIEKDKKLVQGYELEWYKSFSPEEIKKEKLKKDGEKLEMLKTAIFTKGLSQDFIAIRTSIYDDIKNKIDNVILEKNTGNIICALDEVGETMTERYKEKAEKILLRNKKEGGGKLKYGIRVGKNKEEQLKLILGKTENIPLFYLVLPKNYIEGGIKEFITSFEKKSDYEEKLFNYFLSVLFYQINYLKLETNLDLLLKNRLERFEKILLNLKVKA